MMCRVTRLLLIVALAAGGCGDKRDKHKPLDPSYRADEEHPHQQQLDEILTWENRRRDHTDFTAVPPSDIALGPNPFAIVAVADGRFVGALRGAASIVLLDDRGNELFRTAAPISPASLAVDSDGSVLVAGESENVISRFTVISEPPSLVHSGVVPLPDALTVTSIAAAGGVVYATEEIDGRVFAIRDNIPEQIGQCHAPIEVRTVGGYLAVNCLLDHSIAVYRLDRSGMPRGEPVRIRHDGPIWGMSIAERDKDLYVAAGGVEDRKLDRADGGFGYIDSFAFVYRVTGEAERIAMVNLSELGVVTPKWLDLTLGDRASVTVAGYGSDKLARLVWNGPTPKGDPTTRVKSFVPGTTRAARSGAGYVAANMILDAWVYVDADGFEVQRLQRAARSVESHVGERLFFTSLMAPWNKSDGKLSRFTCETCHYEGYVDGRTHYTGRDDSHATTKPLVGLFNNRPHFTRALDKTMTKMVHNEFKVANKFNERDPWFELSSAEYPWLADIEGLPEKLSPVMLRQSLMTFLMEFSHRPNPAVRNKRGFTDLERRGAQIVRAKCESCHSARLVTDDADTAVGYEDWEKLVLSPQGPIVWANDDYQKTGVTPYVNDKGARTTSLRRLYKKWPYFTNGTARSLDDVLARIAISGDQLFHDNAPDGAAKLPDQERAALAAFLRLL